MRATRAAVGTLAFVFAFGVSAHAQDRSRMETPGVKQELLLDASLSQFPGKRITVFIGEFQPGVKTPFHRHPGTELLFVLEGRGTMAIEGRESRELTEGRVVLVEPQAGEASFTHQAANLSETEPMRTLVIVIHDEGTPPAMPVTTE